jgi:hypothetical protein
MHGKSQGRLEQHANGPDYSRGRGHSLRVSFSIQTGAIPFWRKANDLHH